ncbi:recombinase family protein [Mycobacterium sp. SMC-2]|uniref:recombinase family protein n=1 Tax=Mycobacterium sp. SMC-2 TaxID=2857058 RepID=UPI0021B34A2F|nr:recombinase family protein [Mycobacterium sp. SMC-2]UXA08672.1 recombinase family protein [Mycobacterium sp. SMC-2]
MRAAVYLRQSQDRSGEGLGIDRQREDCQKLIEARGWKVVAEFVENDVSATSRKPRPQFSAMMKRVDAGDFDVIVSRHMDRLLRKLSELESVLERCEAHKAAIVTAADGVDTSTDGGKLVARILSSVAQGEVERKGARQKSAAIQAAQMGKWIGGRRAFGYEPDGITVRDTEAAMIRQGYADVLAGMSLAEIARRWNAAGFVSGQGNPWQRHTVKEVLTNPRNAGLRRHRAQDDRSESRKDPEYGIKGRAEWDAIVPEDTWRAAVRVLCDPSRRRAPTGAKGLLTGVAVCGVCGEFVNMSGGHQRGIRNYRCRTQRHVARLAEPVDRYVSDVVLGVLKRPDAQKLWSPDDTDVAALMAEADVLRRRKDDIALDYADGVMSREQFRAANERVLSRLADLESRIAASGSSSPLSIVASADVDNEWENASVAHRRQIIAALTVPVLHHPGRGVRTFRPESVTFRWHGRTE